MAGWQAVLDVLVRERGTALVGYGYLLTGDLREAEDLLQDSLVKVFARGRPAHEVASAEALVGGRGPFGPLLEQIYAWEAGELTGVNAQPQRIQRMAAIYLEATQFADQVFSHAEARPS